MAKDKQKLDWFDDKIKVICYDENLEEDIEMADKFRKGLRKIFKEGE